jgi:hypothetical protein
MFSEQRDLHRIIRQRALPQTEIRPHHEEPKCEEPKRGNP